MPESRRDPPNLNTGEPWSEMSLSDIRWQVEHGRPVAEIADFLCRTRREMRDKIAELGLADEHRRRSGGGR